VLERIAVGGMAEVFRADDPRERPPRTVVLKRMLPALASDEAARAMFAEEARLGALVQHPGVVRVLGHDENHGQPFLVMDHVPGLDLWRLNRWLTRHGRSLDLSTVVYIARRLLEALHAVHQATDGNGQALGLVHRDVSPSNILLSLEGEVKLTDFGIAEASLRESPRHAAMLSRAKGKLGYLSPEQVRGETADARADVFSAAVVIAELFLGRPLFAGGTELAILLAIRDAQVRPFEELASRLPARLHGAVLAALHASPEQRTASAMELAEAMAPFESAQPRLVMRRLAALVREAVGTAISGAASLQRTTSPDSAQSNQPVTKDAPTILYRVRHAGDVLGPFTYARIVEAIATREVGATDEVSLQGGAFSPLAQHPDLFRHLPASSLSETTRDRTGTGGADREVQLSQTSIVKVMGQLLLEGESGLLLCAQGGVRKEVYLEKGVPVFVTSNLQSELLGEFLVRRSLVSRAELDMALAVMPRFEGRLGDTLTALGLVEPVQLFREIGLQVQEKLLELFGWRIGKAEFFRGVPQPKSAFPLGLDAWRMLSRGVERRIAAGLERELLEGRKGLFVSLARPAPRGLAHAELGALLRGTLELVERTPQLGELLHALRDPTGRDVLRGQREVALLVGIGALQVDV
jgi:serine/threonine-protein kinase